MPEWDQLTKNNNYFLNKNKFTISMGNCRIEQITKETSQIDEGSGATNCWLGFGESSLIVFSNYAWFLLQEISITSSKL